MLNFSATPSCPNKLAKTTLLLILLTAVCVNAEWKFDNDPDVQERGDKRDEEREEARKALDRVRFGVKFEVGGGAAITGESLYAHQTEGGIMLNFPLSRLNNGNLVLATELNFGFNDAYVYDDNHTHYQETYLKVPLILQYVSFFYPASDIQVHWVPSPKRHVFMHLKTIMEAGAFIDIPFGTNYDDRNSFDLGGIVGYAFQLENIISGLRATASYVNFNGSSLLLQGKLYFGYLF